MSVAITYNGTSPGTPAGKIRYSESYDRAVFSGEFYMDPSNYATKIDSLNEWDGTLSITSGNWSRSFNVSSNAVATRATCEKIGTPVDGTGLIKVRLTVLVERHADKSGDNGWREWSFNCQENEQGQKIITINAVVTATSGNSAKDNLDAYIATVQTAALTLFGLTASDIETPATVIRDVDRHTNILKVQRTITQLFETVNKADSGGSESKDTTAIFTDWEVTLRSIEEQGHDEGAVRMYTVRWESLVSLGQNVTKEQIEADFAALVIKRLKSSNQFNEDADLVLIGNTEVRISSSRGRVGATWTFRALQGTLISYVEEIELDLTVMEFLKNHSGVDFEGEFFSPGLQGDIIQTVTVVEQDGTPGAPPAPTLVGFGEDLSLGLKRLNMRKGTTNAGRAVGLGTNASRAAVDTAVVFRYTWGIRKRPSNSPLGDRISGVKGNPARALALFVSD